MNNFDVLLRLLSVAPAAVALLVAIAGLTTVSRRRRLEVYFRAAADDEQGRSVAREAILRSLQREAVGWSIADRAVSKTNVFAPMVAYVIVTLQQFFSGRLLAQDLATGNRVWFGVLDLAVPETPIGGVVWAGLLGVIVMGATSPAIRYYFMERQRIVNAYKHGAPTIVHRTFWAHNLEFSFKQRTSKSKPSGATVSTDRSDPRPPRLFRLKMTGAALGSAALAVNAGLLSTGGELVIERAEAWILVLFLSGSLGFVFLGGGLVLGAVAGRVLDREWCHPVDELPDLRTRRARQIRPRLAPARRVSRRHRPNHRV